MKNFNTRVGLGDGIVQRCQAVYETVSGSIDPIVRDNEQVNLELTHLKRKVKSRVCLRCLSETRGITAEPTTLLPRNQINLF